MSSKHTPIKDVYHGNINLNKKKINRQEIIQNLCEEILLGLNLEKQHTTVIFLHSKTETDLSVNELKNKIFSLTASNLVVLWLFASLKAHYRIYIDVDQQFPAQDVEHL